MTTQTTTVLRNATIYTGDAAQPWASALAIAGERIVWLGADHEVASWITSTTEQIDCGGRLVLPGLIDSHFHLLLGARALGQLQLDDVPDLPECQRRLGEYAASRPGQQWLSGRGWKYSMFGGAPIHRRWLDAVVPDRPVLLTAFDGHTAWANTVALEQAGMLHGFNTGSAFSMVVMDEDGTATGELRESEAIDPVRRLIPRFSDDEQAELLRQALGELAALGITSIHNMDGNPVQLALYRSFAERDQLSLRVYLPLSITPGMELAQIDEWAALASALQGTRLRAGCVKLFMDGVVESKTAYLLAPYADGTADRGTPNHTQEGFNAFCTHADRLGLQIFTHAIGDGAVRSTLDGYEAAQRANGVRDSRHRVEHVELLDPADLPRFRELGVIASMQPLHANFGYDENNPWRRLAGRERWAWGFPWRVLRDGGAHLAFGSDWPVVSADPLRGIVAAQNRIKLDLSGPESPFPDQRLNLDETIAAYTSGGAYAEFQEHEKGTLRQGMLADLVMLSENIFALPSEQLHQAKVELTMVGGQVVFARTEN
jgi:predicted amidohydrolase YtcJ